MKPEKNVFKTLGLIFLLLSVVSLSTGRTIGVTPGGMNLENPEPGESMEVPFYLSTNFENPVKLEVSHSPLTHTNYREETSSPYTFIPSEASDESTSSWISFPDSQIVLDPADTVEFSNSEGSFVANKKASFNIEVPEDVEPGYHGFKIDIDPVPQNSGAGQSVRTMAVTSPIFVYRHEGDVVREGEIVSVEGSRAENGKAEVDVVFKNSGNVSLKSRISSMELYNETGSMVENISGSDEIISPGKGNLSVSWDDGNPEESKQRSVSIKVDYMTGEDSYETVVTIPPKESDEKKEEKKEEREPEEMSSWLLIGLLASFWLLIFAVIYRKLNPIVALVWTFLGFIFGIVYYFWNLFIAAVVFSSILGFLFLIFFVALLKVRSRENRG